MLVLPGGVQAARLQSRQRSQCPGDYPACASRAPRPPPSEVLHARGANVDLDFDKVGVDSIDGGADGFEKHFLARREDEIRYRRRTEGEKPPRLHREAYNSSLIYARDTRLSWPPLDGGLPLQVWRRDVYWLAVAAVRSAP